MHKLVLIFSLRRRRREGKTDYRSRSSLIKGRNLNGDCLKYRISFRSFNSRISLQISQLAHMGDLILSENVSSDVVALGLCIGLTNYSIAYALGVMSGRVCLKKIGLLQKSWRPKIFSTHLICSYNSQKTSYFSAVFDVGLLRTSTGSRIFASIKGLNDTGVLIPHSHKRFVGYDIVTRRLRKHINMDYILSGHVSRYMEYLWAGDHGSFLSVFSKYVESNIKPRNLSSYWTRIHDKILYIKRSTLSYNKTYTQTAYLNKLISIPSRLLNVLGDCL